jgi:hypothetical protein
VAFFEIAISNLINRIFCLQKETVLLTFLIKEIKTGWNYLSLLLLTKLMMNVTFYPSINFLWSKIFSLTVIATLATITKWMNVQCSPLVPVLWWGAWSQRGSHGGWYAGSIASLGCDEFTTLLDTPEDVDFSDWFLQSSPHA